MYACSRCSGTGRLAQFGNVLGGTCFKCNGSGKQGGKRPPKPTTKWAIFGQHRATGQWMRLYNVAARTARQGVERALTIYAGASAAWRAAYDLNPATARAIRWCDMADQQATTWAEASPKKEAA